MDRMIDTRSLSPEDQLAMYNGMALDPVTGSPTSDVSKWNKYNYLRNGYVVTDQEIAALQNAAKTGSTDNIPSDLASFVPKIAASIPKQEKSGGLSSGLIGGNFDFSGLGSGLSDMGPIMGTGTPYTGPAVNTPKVPQYVPPDSIYGVDGQALVNQKKPWDIPSGSTVQDKISYLQSLSDMYNNPQVSLSDKNGLIPEYSKEEQNLEHMSGYSSIDPSLKLSLYSLYDPSSIGLTSQDDSLNRLQHFADLRKEVDEYGSPANVSKRIQDQANESMAKEKGFNSYADYMTAERQRWIDAPTGWDDVTNSGVQIYGGNPQSPDGPIYSNGWYDIRGDDLRIRGLSGGNTSGGSGYYDIAAPASGGFVKYDAAGTPHYLVRGSTYAQMAGQNAQVLAGDKYDQQSATKSANPFKDILPLLSLAASVFIPGLAAYVGEALGASGTAASVLGNAVISGVKSGLSSEDALTGALKGGLGALAGDALSKSSDVSDVGYENSFDNGSMATALSSDNSAITNSGSGLDALNDASKKSDIVTTDQVPTTNIDTSISNVTDPGIGNSVTSNATQLASDQAALATNQISALSDPELSAATDAIQSSGSTVQDFLSKLDPMGNFAGESSFDYMGVGKDILKNIGKQIISAKLSGANINLESMAKNALIGSAGQTVGTLASSVLDNNTDLGTNISNVYGQGLGGGAVNLLSGKEVGQGVVNGMTEQLGKQVLTDVKQGINDITDNSIPSIITNAGSNALVDAAKAVPENKNVLNSALTGAVSSTVNDAANSISTGLANTDLGKFITNKTTNAITSRLHPTIPVHSLTAPNATYTAKTLTAPAPVAQQTLTVNNAKVFNAPTPVTQQQPTVVTVKKPIGVIQNG